MTNQFISEQDMEIIDKMHEGHTIEYVVFKYEYPVRFCEDCQEEMYAVEFTFGGNE
jgi:hypothetical protein